MLKTLEGGFFRGANLSGANQRNSRHRKAAADGSRPGAGRDSVLRSMQRAALGGFIALTVAGSGIAMAEEEVKILAPGAITFKADANVPGVAIAVISGSPKEGPYTVRAKFSENVKIPAHFHPDTRVVTVISGTYYFGAGDKYNQGAIKGYGPGTVIIVPANAAHYAGSAEDGAVVQESGTGPTGITLTGK